MGRSMYNFGKQTKEKARQQKQLDKASKRLLAKQQKTEAGKDASSVDAGGAAPENTAPGEMPQP